jgi:hypothetical protein
MVVFYSYDENCACIAERLKTRLGTEFFEEERSFSFGAVFAFLLKNPPQKGSKDDGL